MEARTASPKSPLRIINGFLLYTSEAIPVSYTHLEQLAKNGSKPTFLLGARSDKDLLQLEYLAAYGDVYTTTEDGSHGEKGYVTQHSILSKVNFEQIYTCGPKPMRMAVAKYAKSKKRCYSHDAQ